MTHNHMIIVIAHQKIVIMTQQFYRKLIDVWIIPQFLPEVPKLVSNFTRS